MERPAGSPPPASGTATSQLVTLYQWAQAYLLARVAALVGQAPATTAGALQVQASARKPVRQVTQLLATRTPALIAAVIDEETTAGTDAAETALEPYRAAGAPLAPRGTGAGGTGAPPPPAPPGSSLDGRDEPFDLHRYKAERAVDAIRADLTSELDDVRRRVTRLPDDVYKAIAPQGAMALVTDRFPLTNATPEQAMGAAWQTFVQQGVTGFTDRAGRNWSLSAYVEMAVRTAAHRAYLEADLARMHAVGVHLFSIPDEDHACPLCFPWQGRILADDANMPPVGTVFDATIAQARATGLFHPNCRHPLIPYFPGFTRVQPREWGPENADAYAATQRLRALEVRVRKAKARAEYAADPAAQKTARRKVRAAQAAIRAHLAEHPDLNRRSHREQLNLRMHETALPGAEH